MSEIFGGLLHGIPTKPAAPLRIREEACKTARQRSEGSHQSEVGIQRVSQVRTKKLVPSHTCRPEVGDSQTIVTRTVREIGLRGFETIGVVSASIQTRIWVGVGVVINGVVIKAFFAEQLAEITKSLISTGCVGFTPSPRGFQTTVVSEDNATEEKEEKKTGCHGAENGKMRDARTVAPKSSSEPYYRHFHDSQIRVKMVAKELEGENQILFGVIFPAGHE